MRFGFRIAFLCVVLLGQGCAPQMPKLINNNSVHPALLKAFQIAGYRGESTPEALNVYAQTHFLRKAGAERWEMKSIHEDKREHLLPYLEELKVLQDIYPLKSFYDHVLILGATVSSMRKRVATLEDLWRSGVRFKNIYFLVGTRPLDPKVEGEEVLYDPRKSEIPFRAGWRPSPQRPQTEDGAAKLVWDQVISDKELREKTIQYISASEVKDIKSGKMRRANTADTIRAWISLNPEPGSVLIISNNPYIPYQYATVSGILRHHGFVGEQIDAAGQGDRNTPVAVHLDNLARWLYTELHNQ